MKVERITSLLVVAAIEPLLPLWRDALGYQVVAEVPENPASASTTQPIGFVILVHDGQQVMIQTQASLVNDIPAVAAEKVTSLLYIDVEDLDAHIAAMKDAKLLVGPRTTFYGAREAFFLTSSGHVVAFAEHTKSEG
jgi:hypothetical protein